MGSFKDILGGIQNTVLGTLSAECQAGCTPAALQPNLLDKAEANLTRREHLDTHSEAYYFGQLGTSLAAFLIPGGAEDDAFDAALGFTPRVAGDDTGGSWIRQLLRPKTTVYAHTQDSTTPLTDLAEKVRTSGLHPAAVNQRAIAVGVNGQGDLFAGSSTGFDAGQRAALDKLGISRVPGYGMLHAEEELVLGVPDLQRIGVSGPPICGPDQHNCLGLLTRIGVGIEQ